jgi:hypothetical protein
MCLDPEPHDACEEALLRADWAQISEYTARTAKGLRTALGRALDTADATGRTLQNTDAVPALLGGHGGPPRAVTRVAVERHTTTSALRVVIYPI